MFDIADRLEILNLIGAYSHYYDEGDFEAWASLFRDDAIFTFTGAVEATFSGKERLLQIPSAYREALARGEQGRHYLTNITVLEQTEREASVAALALLSGIGADGKLSYYSPGRYTGTLVACDDGSWRISQWQLHLDRPLNPEILS